MEHYKRLHDSFISLMIVAKVRWISQLEFDALANISDILFGEMSSLILLDYATLGHDGWTFHGQREKECELMLKLQAENDSIFMQYWFAELPSMNLSMAS